MIISVSEVSNIVSDNCEDSENACLRATKSIPKVHTYVVTYYFSAFFHTANLMMCRQNAEVRPEAQCSS